MAWYVVEMFTPALWRRGRSEGRCLPGSLHITLISLIAAFAVATIVQESDAKVVAHGEGVTVVVTTPSRAAPSGEMTGVNLNIEVTEQESVELYGYRSMDVVADIDCAGGRDRVRKAQAFDLPDLAGPSHMRRAAGQWVRPTPGAFMSDVIEKACSSAGHRLASPLLATAVPPAGATPPHATPNPAASVSVAATPPNATPTPASSVPVGATSPRATPNPPASAMASQALPGPVVARNVSGTARLRAQIASSSNEQGARAILQQAGRMIPSPLTGDVEAAQVRGKTVYRSVVEGFASEADAQSFCARMKQARVDCIVWKDRNTGSR